MYFETFTIGIIVVGIIIIVVGLWQKKSDRDFAIGCVIVGICAIALGLAMASATEVYDVTETICEKGMVNSYSVIETNNDVYYIQSVKDYMRVNVGDNVTLNVRETNFFGVITKSATVISPLKIGCGNITCVSV